MRRTLLLLVLIVASLGATSCAVSHRSSITTDVADPDVTWDGTRYVLHSTNTPYGNVPTWTSTDLGTWTFTGDALPALPSWAEPGWTWAPTTIRRPDGKWFLYFSAAVRGRTTANGERLKCIGVAVADRAAGPFTVLRERDAAPLVCQPEIGGDIDPSAYRNAATGLTYLATKVDGNSMARPTEIQNWRLSPNLWSIAMGPATLLKSTIGTWERQVIEGPDLLSVAGGLHLLYSGGDFAKDTYGQGQARCAGTGGICVRNGRLFENAASGTGAGGGSAFTGPTGAPLLAWHAYLDPTVRTRSLMLGTLSSASGGVLVVSGSPIPAGSAGAPAQRAAGVPGSTELTVPEGTRVTVPNAHTR